MADSLKLRQNVIAVVAEVNEQLTQKQNNFSCVSNHSPNDFKKTIEMESDQYQFSIRFQENCKSFCCCCCLKKVMYLLFNIPIECTKCHDSTTDEPHIIFRSSPSRYCFIFITKLEFFQKKSSSYSSAAVLSTVAFCCCLLEIIFSLFIIRSYDLSSFSFFCCSRKRFSSSIFFLRSAFS